MQNVRKQVLIELAWLAVSAGLSLLFSLFLFGGNLLGNSIDIHLYYTYFVIAPFQILLPLFLFVTFLFYFFKELRHSFRRTLPNWILIIIGLTLLIAFTLMIKTFSQAFTGGWTSYPPLSALVPDKNPAVPQDPAISLITNFFAVVQVFVLAMLLFVAFRWGTHNLKTKR